ncbi:hypothetical protein OSTOST_18460 [Ostertagia ostertagi]
MNLFRLFLDLKPNNILVNSAGYVKLSDFGLSRMSDPSHQSHSTLAATIYMPPERFVVAFTVSLFTNCLRIESDIWSFGLSLWELAVGHYPLQTPKDALLTTFFNSGSDRQPYAEHIAGHPQMLCVLINGCLQHDVKLRWKVTDLIQSDYISEAYPINHNAIKEFVIRIRNT